MKVLILKLDDKLYEELERRAKSEGFTLVTEYVKSLILKQLGYMQTHHMVSEHVEKPFHTPSEKLSGIVDKLVTIIERKIMDKVNPFTSKIDEFGRRLAEIVERIEMIEDKLKSLEEKFQYSAQQKVQEEQLPRKRKSAIEILKEQKIIFESDIAKRIRDRDTFFLKLQREGAKIIEAQNERIAIDKDFWEEFKKKIRSLTTTQEEEIKSILDPDEFRLFEKLRESALLYFNAVNRRWELLLE